MPSFLTQCPHCLTPFRVTDSQLEAADGLVRCGACLGIFSAASNRITLKQTPEEAAAAALADPQNEYEDDEEFDDNPAADEYDEEDAEDAFAEQHAEELLEELPEAVPAEILVANIALPEVSTIAASQKEAPPTQTSSTAGADFSEFAHDPELLAQDFDVPLGDFNLDSDEEPEENDAEYATEEDDELDDDFEEDEYDDDYEDEEEESEAEELEEESEPEEEYAEEFEALEDEEVFDEADDALPPPVERRPAPERITTDKTALRQYLAEIEDDEALEPLDDEAFDDFEEPVTLVAAPRRSRLGVVALLLANVVLAGALLLQYASANLAALNRNARVAPVMPYLCRVLDCPLVERSQLDSLVSEQLVVRSHPRYAQALEVSLVFRNDAAEAQPFPAIELGFSDTGNRLVANRLVQPAEYLPNELQTSEMPARSSLQITLEMEDPGSEAVNYTLVFREP